MKKGSTRRPLEVNKVKNISKYIEKIEHGDAWEENDTVIELKFKKPLDKVIPIRLQAEHWRRLKLEARELGIGPTTLARMWIIERLRKNDKLQQEALIGILNKSLNEEKYPNLNQFEYNLLNLLAKGLTNKQVAEALNITADKLQSHVLEILQKLEETRSKEYPSEKGVVNQ
jgi:DNA-binding CsgD family transcriptional regulator